MAEGDNGGGSNWRDSVILKGPGGFGAEFRGKHVPNLLRFLIFLLLALLFALGYQAAMENRKEHEALKGAIEIQAESQREITYILTLPPADREALKLTMPDSLRKRMR